MKMIWTAAGCICVAIGVVGIVVPLLPTVPLMLLAAFCFARGSQRFHDWLVDHPRFGPPIRDWRANGSISRQGKTMACVAAIVTFSISLTLSLPAHVLAIQAVVLATMMVFVLSRPSAGAKRIAD